MSEVTPKIAVEDQPTRRGKVLYETNPSVADNFPIKIKAKLSKNIGNAYIRK